MKRIDILQNQRLILWGYKEHKVVVTEEALKSFTSLKMTVRGTSGDLMVFNEEYCQECQVGNHETDLIEMSKRVACIVKDKNLLRRLCALDGSSKCEPEENFAVPDDNWYEIDPRILNGLMQVTEVKENIQMSYDENFDMVVGRTKKEVFLTGNGKMVEIFWRNVCGLCEANPDKYSTLPEFDGRESLTFVCRFKQSKKNEKLCDEE